MSPVVTAPRAWQRMLSGRRLDLLDPSPLDIEISDIAHGLARVARWNGQTRGDHAFSVAQHCLVVEEIFRRCNEACTADALQMTILHDAPEYVIGDMISPFKSVVGGGYKAVEQRLEAAIHLRFGLPRHPTRELKALIKKADTIAAFFEATELAGFSVTEARKFFGQPRGITRDMLPIQPMPALAAQQLFLDRFHQIEAERAGKTA
ncbi:Metal dependent phosphohydrolase [Neorhizobium galegae bv. officinalis]|uniref:Metal dependent phosphohydrolase n=2 Tax=Neorhizobium galegae TaxID=399 RepID=A0A0T7FUJ8_NEOGA|nr:Metal dependent phosphohydrolase [Neorhizobium galegae bv. officinalis]